MPRKATNLADAQTPYLEAANQPSHITEISYFAGKALEKLGRPQEARALYEAMLSNAENRLKNADLHGYFGVGMPSPLPFELNILRQNSIPALLVKALALKGLDRMDESRSALAELLELDPHGTPLAFFRALEIL